MSQEQTPRPDHQQQPVVQPLPLPARDDQEPPAAGQGSGRGRNKNKLEPHPAAVGPHSTFKRDPNSGKVTNYETYQRPTDPRNPSPWVMQKRYDGAGGGHYIPSLGKKVLPHVHDPSSEEGVRVPTEEEIPK